MAPYVPRGQGPADRGAPREGLEVGSTNMLRVLPGDAAHHVSLKHFFLSDHELSQASEDVVPTSQLREAYAKIRELERALGRKTMEVEILRAAQEIVKKNAVVAQRVRTVTHLPITV